MLIYLVVPKNPFIVAYYYRIRNMLNTNLVSSDGLSLGIRLQVKAV